MQRLHLCHHRAGPREVLRVLLQRRGICHSMVQYRANWPGYCFGEFKGGNEAQNLVF